MSTGDLVPIFNDFSLAMRRGQLPHSTELVETWPATEPSSSGTGPADEASSDEADYVRLMSPQPSTSAARSPGEVEQAAAPGRSEAEPHRWPMLDAGASSAAGSELLCPSDLRPMPPSPIAGPSGAQLLAQPAYQAEPGGVLLRSSASSGDAYLVSSSTGQLEPAGSARSDAPPPTPGMSGLVDSTVDDADGGELSIQSESELETEDISSSCGHPLVLTSRPEPALLHRYMTDDGGSNLVIYDYVLDLPASGVEASEREHEGQLSGGEPEDADLPAVAAEEREALRRERDESRPSHSQHEPVAEDSVRHRHQQRDGVYPAAVSNREHLEQDQYQRLQLEQEEHMLQMERDGDEGLMELEQEQQGMEQVAAGALGEVDGPHGSDDENVAVLERDDSLIEEDNDAFERDNRLLERSDSLLERDESMLEIDGAEPDDEDSLLAMEHEEEEVLLKMECGDGGDLLTLEDGRRAVHLFEREGDLSAMGPDFQHAEAVLSDGTLHRDDEEGETEALEPTSAGNSAQHQDFDEEGGRRLRPPELAALPVIYLSEGLDAPLDGEGARSPAGDPLQVSTVMREDSRQADFWCEECCCFYQSRCPDHQVRLISDRPLRSRAWASLPISYLSIRAVQPAPSATAHTVYGVVAKKAIPKRTQFGPMEGILVKRDRGGTAPNPSGLVLSVDAGDQLHTVDVSNPDCSNWMRFVRRAETLKQQNLVLNQQGSHLFFTSCCTIAPREELRAGYSLPYASRRGLPMLTAKVEDPSEAVACDTCGGDAPDSCSCGVARSSRPGRAQGRLREGTVHRRSTSDAEPSQPSWSAACQLCGRSISSSERHQCHLSARPAARTRQTASRAQPAARHLPARWRCQYCPLRFESASTLNLHTLAHAAEDLEGGEGLPSAPGEEALPPDLPLRCPQCCAEFATREELIEHVATHGTEQPAAETEEVNCADCSRGSSHRQWLRRHQASDAERPVPCGTCGRRFLTASSMQCHRRVHDEGVRRYTCPLCRLVFESVNALREHVRMHAVDGKYTCPQCNKSFDGYLPVRKHIRAFHSERAYICPLCYKTLPVHRQTQMHMLKHSDHREFLCSECGKQFKRKDKLKEHVKRLHSQERKTAQERAIRHQRQQQQAQADQYPPKVPATDYHRFIYKCHKCKLGFKRRGMLVNHLAKRHPGMGPEQVPELMLPILKTTKDFFCQYCDKTYKSSSKRKAHILKNHPGAELPASTRNIKLPPGESADRSSFSRTVCSVTMAPHGCVWCHKQYASRAKLLQHQRLQHRHLLPAESQIPRLAVRAAAQPHRGRQPGPPVPGGEVDSSASDGEERGGSAPVRSGCASVSVQTPEQGRSQPAPAASGSQASV